MSNQIRIEATEYVEVFRRDDSAGLTTIVRVPRQIVPLPILNAIENLADYLADLVPDLRTDLEREADREFTTARNEAAA